MYTNADVLSNKMADLKVKVSLVNPDIVAICETWFQRDPLNKKFYPDECVTLQGYNCYRYDNPGALKGGLILYIKPSIDSGICKDMKKFSVGFEESAWHWITLPKISNTNSTDKLMFGCIYRKGASSNNNNEELHKVMEKACKLSDIVTVCGDFNFPGISWQLHQSSNESESMFLDVVDDTNLVQHVDTFTRKRGTDNPSLLDLVLTDDQQVISKPIVSEPLGKSDHSVICWNSTFKCYNQDADQSNNSVPKFNYYKGDYKQMRDELDSVDWTIKFSECKDVNDMVREFQTVVLNKVESLVPKKLYKSRRNSKQAPWITHSLLKNIKRKYHAWKRLQDTKSHQMYLEYAKIRRKTSKKIRTAKKEFEKKLDSEAKVNPKHFIDMLIAKRKQLPILLD